MPLLNLYICVIILCVLLLIWNTIIITHTLPTLSVLIAYIKILFRKLFHVKKYQIIVNNTNYS